MASKKNTRKWTASEQKSYRKGFFAGLFSAKKKKKGLKKPITKKQSVTKKKSFNKGLSMYSDPLYKLCGMYAEHMSVKFGNMGDGYFANPERVAREAYFDAKNNPKLARDHFDNYGLRLSEEDRKKFLRSVEQKPSMKKANKRPPKKDGYSKMIRDMEDRKRDLFADDFDRDSKGRIKGSYTPDGFFEPD